MKIAVVGMGRVGLVTAAALADFGHIVHGVEIEERRLEALRTGIAPFYEPGLQELLQKNLLAGRIIFYSSIAEAIRDTTAVFIAVGTEDRADGHPVLEPLFAVAEEVVRTAHTYIALFIKSTVPVGTAARLHHALEPIAAAKFDVVSNPEFLREGSAIENFMRPDRIVVGTSSEHAREVAREVYRPLHLINIPGVWVDWETAEVIKYATNAFLAVKITFINEIASLCDATGADVHDVAKAIGLDRRIGDKFLHPGPGFGGSCLPKDSRTLVEMGREFGVDLPLIQGMLQSNCAIANNLLAQLVQRLEGLRGKTIAVLGLSYKPFTDDVRESPAIHIVRLLLERGVQVKAHDPLANEEARTVLGPDCVAFHSSAAEAAQDADALVLLTEWNEFRALNMQKIFEVMRGNLLLDARNVFDPALMVEIGFQYLGRGRTTRPTRSQVRAAAASDGCSTDMLSPGNAAQPVRFPSL